MNMELGYYSAYRNMAERQNWQLNDEGTNATDGIEKKDRGDGVCIEK